MEPILIYADPESSDRQVVNDIHSRRKYKPQPVLGPNNTLSRRTVSAMETATVVLGRSLLRYRREDIDARLQVHFDAL